MIPLSKDFDLGRDRTRMKDPRDAIRQSQTAEEILRRFYDEDPEKQYELQLLADEVGMGKTFVALAVAYSVLARIRAQEGPESIRGASKKVLIITPRNKSLYRKWVREVQEFVGRCVDPEIAPRARRWFRPREANRFDDFVRAFGGGGKAPAIIVTHMGAFAKKLRYKEEKEQFLLGVLFRHWGNRMQKSRRHALLRGAPDGWTSNPADLTDVGSERCPLSEDETRWALARIDRSRGEGEQLMEDLLQLCRELSEPYVRRAEKFGKVRSMLRRLYRRVVQTLLHRGVSLVIVDEAHNWKNGPSSGTNEYDQFQFYFGQRIRRALLLTATPFQLDPREMIELVRIGDELAPVRTLNESAERRERLSRFREEVLRPTVERSAEASRSFSKAWVRLPFGVDSDALRGIWTSDGIGSCRERLKTLADAVGAVDRRALEAEIETGIAPLDPALREFFREALRLYVYNHDLSAELGRIVVRHRRPVDHRLVRVGEEFVGRDAVIGRPDRQVLHAAPGLDVTGDGELPHYLLMRCVSILKGGRGRSSLGTGLTGCYSTLLDSAEGKTIKKALAENGGGDIYLDLLVNMVGREQDPDHPKMKAAVDEILRYWKAGEKTLVFCFRINTADRLRQIVDDRIRIELDVQRARCLGGGESLKVLRSRLTGRDRDLVVIGLDRVLWSLLLASKADAVALREWGECPYGPTDLRLRREDLREIAREFVRHGIEPSGDRMDRVFLHRVVESILARRLLKAEPRPTRKWRRTLGEIADSAWIEFAYGSEGSAEDETGGEESASFDERGVHTTYEVVEDTPARPLIDSAETILVERWERGRRAGVSIFDVYSKGPSLWLGNAEMDETSPDELPWVVSAIHRHLTALSWNLDWDEFDWWSRREIFQALRRALLRESVLLRILPERTDLEDSRWDSLLVERFFAALPGQSESMADRIEVFLEDLRAASGSLNAADSPRRALLDATKLRDQQFVALVKGGGDDSTRERIFAGFNTPLLPEVLICTSVGQEGIDLHRHCRHVIHYDLAWNPAVIEQRTGRVDRIGSKTFRERGRPAEPGNGAGNGVGSSALSGSSDEVFLEVGLPYLAGTYDERMYEQLRLRAQMFEVLTGGEVVAENREGNESLDQADGGAAGLLMFVPLPEEMIGELRVRLAVATGEGGQ